MRRLGAQGPALVILALLCQEVGASFAVLVFLTAFEVLVAFLQAYIFTTLTAVYINMASHAEH